MERFDLEQSFKDCLKKRGYPVDFKGEILEDLKALYYAGTSDVLQELTIIIAYQGKECGRAILKDIDVQLSNYFKEQKKKKKKKKK